MPDEPIDLKRFEDAHAATFDRVLSEIRTGRKRSHWMWFVFPQVEGLGSSETARRFAIRTRDEAQAFLDHPLLGANYRVAVEEVAKRVVDEGVPTGVLFPHPDDLTLVSSLTLFAGMARASSRDARAGVRWPVRVEGILDAARVEGYESCEVTARFLARHPGG